MQKTFVGIFLFSLLLISSCSSVEKFLEGDNYIPERLSAEAISKDKNIEKYLKDQINKDYLLKDSDLNFMSYNGVLLVVGNLSNKELLDNLNVILKKTEDLGVRKIDNRVEVLDNRTGLMKAQDLMISLRAKTLLEEQEIFTAKHITLLTHNGVIYLMGVVTREEAKYATNQVVQTPGIEKIVRLFEFISKRPKTEEEYYERKEYYNERKAILEKKKRELLDQQIELQKEIYELENILQ